ncbi:MAG TPA: BPSS1780 family membrane protein [Solimonas sp.]
MSDTRFRKVSAGRGLAWISEGFGLFKQAPLLWIGALVLWMILAMLLSLIPFIGSLAVNLTFAMVLGGILLGARQQTLGNPLSLDALLGGFKAPLREPLLLLGVAYLVGAIVIAIVGALMVILVFGTAAFSGDMQDLSFGVGTIIAVLLILLMAVAFSLATWFAPGLIVFHGVKVVDALKLSFAAGMANLGALSVFGIIAILLALAAMIPFGLGLIVLLPILMAASYPCFRDVFGDGSPPGEVRESSIQ